MIAFLQGTIHDRGDGFIILLCHGVGYKISVPEALTREYHGEVLLYTHEVVREDTHELFGFSNMDALQFFWKLITVSGIGPKGAMKIISSGSVSEIKGRIMGGDLDFLSHISGIGKKTAQKIILELKGALVEEGTGVLIDTDAVEALLGLGYPRREAEDAVAGVKGETTEARIRGALQLLGKKA